MPKKRGPVQHGQWTELLSHRSNTSRTSSDNEDDILPKSNLMKSPTSHPTFFPASLPAPYATSNPSSRPTSTNPSSPQPTSTNPFQSLPIQTPQPLAPASMPLPQPPSAINELESLAKRLAKNGPIKTLPTSKRIRVLFNGATIFDTDGTSGALYIWEHDRYPQFYLPMEAIIKSKGHDIQVLAEAPIVLDDNNDTGSAISPGTTITTNGNTSSMTGDNVIAGFLHLKIKRTSEPVSSFRSLREMVLFAADLDGPASMLRNMVKVNFAAVDQWFEEDTPIYVHPRDPYKRVDILTSTRPIRVSISGVRVAESAFACHLYETSLPTRYYIPYTALNTALLLPSSTKTRCPYKGEAEYHSVMIGDREVKDVCWFYERPTIECGAIAGMRCFYNEKVDIEIMQKGSWERVEGPLK